MTVLSTQGLVVAHDEKIVLESFDWQIKNGEKWAILGANGAGKTSLLHALLGVERSVLPYVFLAGNSLKLLTVKQQSELRVWIPQRYDEPFNITVWQAFQSIAHHLGEQKSLDCLAEFDLLRQQHTWVHLLSGGERQRLTWAMALARHTLDTKLWLLDEPFAAQDLFWQHNLLAKLKELPCAVVAAVHDINHVYEFATHVLVLLPPRAEGKGSEVLLGTLDEIMRPEILHRAYGIPLQHLVSQNGQSHWWKV